MRQVVVGHQLADFRLVARGLLADNVAPDAVWFEELDQSQHSLVAAEPFAPLSTADAPKVPRKFVELAALVAAHRDPRRWALLYQALYRLTHHEPHLLDDSTDPVTHELWLLRKSVQQDVHKTHAFVRFRKVVIEGVEHFIAWHEPQHRTLELSAPHFQRRFASMRWAILTPDQSVDWNLQKLTFGPGVPRSQAPRGDELEGLWKSYYASVFNPARLNLRAMTAEMPRRHWKNLPEAELISSLMREAPRRTVKMTAAATPSASASLVPEVETLPSLTAAAGTCLLCPWAAGSTQTVFGEGPARAAVMLVGEQPGDEEDLSGRPFVGPAGQLLDEILREVGLPRDQLYVTNAVKHFKFEPRGKRRIHKKPGQHDVENCQGWLHAEIRTVKPRIIVALGATAGQAFLGPTFRLVRSRGQFLPTPWTEHWLATYHPSALLRASTPGERQLIEGHLRADLAMVVQQWRSGQASPSAT